MYNVISLKESIRILSELGRSEDLAEWNRVQYQLWMSMVNSGLVNKDDFETFGEFGKFFYSFFQEYGRKPTISEVEDAIL